MFDPRVRPTLSSEEERNGQEHAEKEEVQQRLVQRL